MNEDPEVFLDATVPPLMAAVMVRDYGGVLRDLEGRGHALMNAGSSQQTLGRALLRGVSTIRRSGRERLEALRSTSASGTTEPAPESDHAPSVSPSLVSRLTAREVAERYGKTDRYIRQLCQTERLSATKPGREWLIDEVAAIAWFARTKE